MHLSTPQFICPVEERLQMLYVLQNNPLQMTVYGFTLSYSTITTAAFGILLAFASKVLIQEISGPNTPPIATWWDFGLGCVLSDILYLPVHNVNVFPVSLWWEWSKECHSKFMVLCFLYGWCCMEDNRILF